MRDDAAQYSHWAICFPSDRTIIAIHRCPREPRRATEIADPAASGLWKPHILISVLLAEIILKNSQKSLASADYSVLRWGAHPPLQSV